jgi:hypothetical protein
METLLTTLEPVNPILPFSVVRASPTILDNPSRHGLRAPKGGCTVGGKLFKGGQFCLPFDPENPHGLEVETTAPALEPAPENPRDSWPIWTDEERWAITEPPGSGLDLTGFAPRIDGPAPVRLSINGFVYAAREIPAGECGSVAFELHRIDTNHHYHDIRDHFGLVTCDCPSYVFTHEGTNGLCKHGRRLVELGMIPAPMPMLTAPARRASIPASVSSPAPRHRRFEPSPDEMAEAAQLFGNVVDNRVAYRRELAACL